MLHLLHTLQWKEEKQLCIYQFASSNFHVLAPASQPATSNLMQSIDVYIILCTKRRMHARVRHRSQTKQLFLFYIEIMANIWNLNQCWIETCLHPSDSISKFNLIHVAKQSRKKSQQTASVAAAKKNNNIDKIIIIIALAKKEKKSFPTNRWLTDQPIESDS